MMPRVSFLNCKTVNNLPRCECGKLPNYEDAKLPSCLYSHMLNPSCQVITLSEFVKLPSCRVVEMPSYYYWTCRKKMTAREGLKLPTCQAAKLPHCRATELMWTVIEVSKLDTDNVTAKGLTLTIDLPRRFFCHCQRLFVTLMASSRNKITMFASIRKHLLVYRWRRFKQCQRNIANTI